MYSVTFTGAGNNPSGTMNGNIPQLSIGASQIGGVSTTEAVSDDADRFSISTHTSGVYPSFRPSYGGSSATQAAMWNVPTSTPEQIMESIPGITDVSVARSSASIGVGYVYTISFADPAAPTNLAVTYPCGNGQMGQWFAGSYS